MKIGKIWIFGIIAVIVLSGAGLLFINHTQVVAQDPTGTGEAGTVSTVAVQPASLILGEVSAAGNIQLVSQQQVALQVTGVINRIAVNAGDPVKAGDLLLALKTVELERAVRRAELAVAAKQNALAQLTEEADAAAVAVAQANLLQAQENLSEVLAGPGEEEIAAARSNLASTRAKYDEVLAGPSDAELTQLKADLMKKQVALAEAQGAYDKIAWRNSVGMTAEASTLQQATIDYEAAQAAYDEASAPADVSEVQSALSAAQDAQVKLDDLLNSPTEAEIATAQASVTDAQASLEDALEGASATELRDAQIALEQALVDLEEAHVNLAGAKVLAPIDGTVLAVNGDVGERVSQGTVVATIADIRRLELTIDVAEMDVVKIAPGQEASIDIDAFPGRTFAGTVAYVAPSSETSGGIVSYPVTVRLSDEGPGGGLSGVLPGMTAVATVTDNTLDVRDSLLVPTNAIHAANGSRYVTVVTDQGNREVEVVPGGTQGEWTAVQSTQLRVGDQVAGSLVSHTNEDGGFFGGSNRRNGAPVMGPPR